MDTAVQPASPHEPGARQDPRRRLRLGLAILASLGTLAYAVAVVAAAWAAPDKGFVVFIGRRVIETTPGGAVDRAGIEPGDVVDRADGRELHSTLDYIDGLLRRSPGERVRIGFRRGGPDGPRTEVTVRLGHSPPPWAALVAALLAVVLLALGLLARADRPDDPVAIRFWRTTTIYATAYTAGLSWNMLLVHPTLAAVGLAAIFLAPPIAADFSLAFPTAPRRSVRAYRIFAYGTSLALLVGTVASIAWALSDWERGASSDGALRWAVRCTATQLAMTVIVIAGGTIVQLRNARDWGGAERAQLRWLMFGFGLTTVPYFISIPIAIWDIDRFLLVGYRPLLTAGAILWFASVSLAVLRVRLADVPGFIRRTMTYGIASGLAAAVYLAVVLGVGVASERVLGPSRALAHLFAAVAALAVFGPLRARVSAAIDRRFFRDRLHYVQAVRELGEAVAPLREPADLARLVVERAVDALRASSGALYLRPAPVSEQTSAPTVPELELADARGRELPARLGVQEALSLSGETGIAALLRRGESDSADGVLLLGERRGGDLYSSEDRDLLRAFAGQLAVAIENARAFGTIAAMSRALEAQNREIASLRDRLEDENRYLRGRLDDTRRELRIVGRSKVVKELQRQVERIAPSTASVLLTGESGTGKGLVARAIHAASDRADRPFIHVDCGAIPLGVFESELFGHERGAFTGAVRSRRGFFELADGGTLFLDEIGELPLVLQPKLLRALQERSFVRVGGGRPVPVDVRIVAATNRVLGEMVARGEFREDLLYRLKVVEIAVPPLRTRKADLPDLVEWILPELCRRNHKPLRTLSPEASERLEEYGWPGNVRELQNVLERAAILCEGDVIQPNDLALPEAPPPEEDLAHLVALPEDADHRDVMESVEKRRLLGALKAAGGNQSRAARALGIARTTLINKMRRYGLT